MLIPFGIRVGTGERDDTLLERLRDWMRTSE